MFGYSSFIFYILECNSSYTVDRIDFYTFFAHIRRFVVRYSMIFSIYDDIGTVMSLGEINVYISLGEMTFFLSLGNLSISQSYVIPIIWSYLQQVVSKIKSK